MLYVTLLTYNMIIQANIKAVRKSKITDARFTILIPSWNNLDYLQLCVKSIRNNSFYKHQVIVHVNEGADGTLKWVDEQPDIDYTYSEKNIGVCYALNACRSLLCTDYLLYLNDDMYVCPGWDKALHDEIESIGHKYFFLSATAIEPRAQSACSIEKDYGKNISQFNEELLLKEFSALTMKDWSGATWPPNIVHKDIWDLAGGYSVEFSPGMYSDPDFSMKLWQMGVRFFKGINNSRVYHFTSISVKRVKRNKGYYQFINKWGITSSTFTRRYLNRGGVCNGELPEASIPFSLQLKNFYKRIIAAVFYKTQ